MGNLSSKRGGEVLNSTPTGLYDHCEWDPKVVRRLIQERKLAPISIGKEDQDHEGLEECPICFLYYSGGLNRSKCCRKGACTECYLQVKKPNQNTTCPFCNHAQYIVTFSGPLTKEEIAQEAQEQMKVLELKISMRKEEIERDKQRELEKERILKERELSGELNPTNPLSLPGSGTPSTSKQTTNSDSVRTTHSVPSHSSQSSFSTYNQNVYGSSFPLPAGHGFGGDMSNLADPDLDDLMLMEAIRLSLLDVQSQREAPSTLLNDNSDDSDNTDGAEHNSTQTSTTASTIDALFTQQAPDSLPIDESPLPQTPPSPRPPSPQTPPSPLTPTFTTTTSTSASTTQTTTTTTTSATHDDQLSPSPTIPLFSSRSPSPSPPLSSTPIDISINSSDHTSLSEADAISNNITNLPQNLDNTNNSNVNEHNPNTTDNASNVNDNSNNFQIESFGSDNT